MPCLLSSFLALLDARCLIKRESIIAFELELVMDWEIKVLWFCYFVREGNPDESYSPLFVGTLTY